MNLTLLSCSLLLPLATLARPAEPKPIKILVLYENGGHHIEYSKRAKIWLDELAAKRRLAIDYIQNTDTIDEQFSRQYQLFIQLDYPPYAWKPKAAAAFENYIEQGKGGWIGFTTQPCSVSSTATRCGTGSPSSWRYSIQELHRHVRQGEGARRGSPSPRISGRPRLFRHPERGVLYV